MMKHIKEGVLVFDEEKNQYDVYFGMDEYLGGLCCGDCFAVFTDGAWKDTRIELKNDWYLVGVNVDCLSGTRVRIAFF